MIRCSITFHDDVAPAVQTWRGTPYEALTAQAWADAVTALYPGSVLLERKCPTHDAWEKLRLCDACGCFLCALENCDCEPVEKEGDCPDCRMAGSQEHCLGTRTEKGWR